MENEQVTLLDQIGEGYYGKVYVCAYKGKQHVIKKIPKTTHYKEVMAELKVLSQIQHPRIVKLISFYHTNVDYNFILEFMKNGSLRNTLTNFITNRWKFGQNDLMSLFMDISWGVRYLHSKAIIHRDLKPENILVENNHRLKIADFGISKFFEHNEAIYQTSIGTIAYMAPEVYLHKPYNKSIDVWALGMIFYEMAMLQYPFSMADKARILNPLLTFVPPLIDCIRRKYSTDVQDFLELMLQRDPEKRSDVYKICSAPMVRNISVMLKSEESDYQDMVKK